MGEQAKEESFQPWVFRTEGCGVKEEIGTVPFGKVGMVIIIRDLLLELYS